MVVVTAGRYSAALVATFASMSASTSAEARSAYQLALDRSESGSPYRFTLQLKLDSLGEARPAAK